MATSQHPYHLAQSAIANLKAAIHMILAAAPSEGLSNADIGRLLGIYMGHVKHEGHIPRTLLAIMESEGVTVQDGSTKKWRLRSAVDAAD